ncbi:hypothetical protein NA57DRAFT_57491 [Rhizodiscina lignyota]|uniref:Uncharacterized protein n=1 Tax=Rhizodiscina lignyota TaxID=1504668 RepID=A0A9P4IFE5_9PEZI|nr:hypothetical protein NA57DRAFT_57491 [Rhizodiscina lignyota]
MSRGKPTQDPASLTSDGSNLDHSSDAQPSSQPSHTGDHQHSFIVSTPPKAIKDHIRRHSIFVHRSRQHMKARTTKRSRQAPEKIPISIGTRLLYYWVILVQILGPFVASAHPRVFNYRPRGAVKELFKTVCDERHNCHLVPIIGRIAEPRSDVRTAEVPAETDLKSKPMKETEEAAAKKAAQQNYRPSSNENQANGGQSSTNMKTQKFTKEKVKLVDSLIQSGFQAIQTWINTTHPAPSANHEIAFLRHSFPNYNGGLPCGPSGCSIPSLTALLGISKSPTPEDIANHMALYLMSSGYAFKGLITETSEQVANGARPYCEQLSEYFLHNEDKPIACEIFLQILLWTLTGAAAFEGGFALAAPLAEFTAASAVTAEVEGSAFTATLLRGTSSLFTGISRVGVALNMGRAVTVPITLTLAAEAEVAGLDGAGMAAVDWAVDIFIEDTLSSTLSEEIAGSVTESIAGSIAEGSLSWVAAEPGYGVVVLAAAITGNRLGTSFQELMEQWRAAERPKAPQPPPRPPRNESKEQKPTPGHSHIVLDPDNPSRFHVHEWNRPGYQEYRYHWRESHPANHNPEGQRPTRPTHHDNEEHQQNQQTHETQEDQEHQSDEGDGVPSTEDTPQPDPEESVEVLEDLEEDLDELLEELGVPESEEPDLDDRHDSEEDEQGDNQENQEDETPSREDTSQPDSEVRIEPWDEIVKNIEEEEDIEEDIPEEEESEETDEEESEEEIPESKEEPPEGEEEPPESKEETPESEEETPESKEEAPEEETPEEEAPKEEAPEEEAPEEETPEEETPESEEETPESEEESKENNENEEQDTEQQNEQGGEPGTPPGSPPGSPFTIFESKNGTLIPMDPKKIRKLFNSGLFNLTENNTDEGKTKRAVDYSGALVDGMLILANSGPVYEKELQTTMCGERMYLAPEKAQAACEEAVGAIKEEVQKLVASPEDPQEYLEWLRGIFGGDDGHGTRNLLGLHHWQKKPQELVHKWEGMELSGMLAQLWADQQCYSNKVTAGPKDIAEEVDCENENIYCDPDGWMAQALCYDGEDQDNTRLWGHKHLDESPWEMTLKRIAEVSYKAYKAGAKPGISHPGALVLDIGNISQGKFVPEPALPVCASETTVIEDWDQDADHFFPSHCGNRFGNETEAFWNASNFQNSEHKKLVFELIVDEWKDKSDRVATFAKRSCTAYYILIWPENRTYDKEHLYEQGKRLCQEMTPIFDKLQEPCDEPTINQEFCDKLNFYHANNYLDLNSHDDSHRGENKRFLTAVHHMITMCNDRWGTDMEKEKEGNCAIWRDREEPDEC